MTTVKKNVVVCSTNLIQISDCLFVILLLGFNCFWTILVSNTCDESTLWVRKLCKSTGYILPSPRLRTRLFLQKNRIASLYPWSVRLGRKNRRLKSIGSNLEPFNQNLPFKAIVDFAITGKHRGLV